MSGKYVEIKLWRAKDGNGNDVPSEGGQKSTPVAKYVAGGQRLYNRRLTPTMIGDTAVLPPKNHLLCDFVVRGMIKLWDDGHITKERLYCDWGATFNSHEFPRLDLPPMGVPSLSKLGNEVRYTMVKGPTSSMESTDLSLRRCHGL